MKSILFTRTTFICTLFWLLTWTQTTSAQYVDLFGDAQDTFAVGGPLLDIDTINVQFDELFLLFEMTFHTPISAPSLFLDDSVGGTLEFDIDRTSETGGMPVQNSFSPPFASLDAGVDFRLDFFSEANNPGFVILTDENGVFVADIAIAYTGNSFSGMIPLAMLGNSDGLLDFTSIIGTFQQPTDETDSIGTSFRAVPEPASAFLLFSGLVGLLTARRKRSSSPASRSVREKVTE